MNANISSAMAGIVEPSTSGGPAADIRELRQCHEDMERLLCLPTSWRGLDPSGIAEDLLGTLVEMLELDFAGLCFRGDSPIFLRMSEPFPFAHEAETVRHTLEAWLSESPGREPAPVCIGGERFAVSAFETGDGGNGGMLFAGSRRMGFPQGAEAMRLKLAATQGELAFGRWCGQNDRAATSAACLKTVTDTPVAECERHADLVIDAIPVMAWTVNTSGMVDSCNQQLLDFVGLPEEVVLGTGFHQIFHPDDRDHLRESLQEPMASKRTVEADGRVRRFDGEYRWFSFRQGPLIETDGAVVTRCGVLLDIDERKRDEVALSRSALKASEQSLRLAIDSLPVLVWVARPDGSAEYVNRSWAEYAGVEPERILGWGFLDFYHPEDAPGMVEMWRDARENKESVDLKGRIRRSDGEYRWFYFSGRKIIDANGAVRWVGANLDIEDWRRAEDALKASEQRLKLIIDTIPAMAWSATADGKVDFWNKNLLDFCGLRFEDVMGEGFYRIFHPDDLEVMGRTWESVRANKRGKEVDGRILRADGEYRWFNLRQNPLLDENGDVVKWYGALIEIEDRKRAEEELNQSRSELARVARMTTLGELAVSIAHEVNQPLMAIVTNAGTCLRWLDDANFDIVRARQAAERVIRDGHRAGDIVTGIRALARKEPPRVAPMDLHDAIRDVLSVLSGEFRRFGIDASYEPAPGPLVVLGDRTQLQQVILNLVMNSVEAMTDVERTSRQLTIRSGPGHEGFVCVSVFDTGPGLTLEHMDRIFEAFFSTKTGGIGMGLSICRSIVEAHGGSISASENSPKGSIFSFTVRSAAGVAQ